MSFSFNVNQTHRLLARLTHTSLWNEGIHVLVISEVAQWSVCDKVEPWDDKMAQPTTVLFPELYGVLKGGSRWMSSHAGWLAMTPRGQIARRCCFFLCGNNRLHASSAATTNKRVLYVRTALKNWKDGSSGLNLLSPGWNRGRVVKQR